MSRNRVVFKAVQFAAGLALPRDIAIRRAKGRGLRKKEKPTMNTVAREEKACVARCGRR